MTDSILDEVQALLDKEFGDKRILEQIQRAAQNNEVISNFERNYVRKLAEKHLGLKPPVESKPPEVPKQTIPDNVIESPSFAKPQAEQIWSQPPKTAKSSSKNTTIMLGIGIAVLAIIIIAAVSLSGISDITPNQTESFSIQTDSTSYQRGDIISLNGKSNLSLGNPVSLSITNSDNDLVWSEQVNVKNNGQFTTLTFAGGSGWEEPGTYTVKAVGGSGIVTNTFSFRG